MTTVQLITQAKEYSPHKLAANNKVPTGQGKLESQGIWLAREGSHGESKHV